MRFETKFMVFRNNFDQFFENFVIVLNRQKFKAPCFRVTSDRCQCVV